MAKSPYSPKFKANISQRYLNGKGSYKALAARYNISATTIKSWVAKYKVHGKSAFCSHTAGNAAYTKEFKLQCVLEVISGTNSIKGVTAKYNISSASILRDWILRYNAGRELTDYLPERGIYMATARRKTTLDERKEIVSYCIEHNRDYKSTAKLYNVSYSQVYGWVRKYDQQGENALIDNRGRHKTDDELDENECLRRKILRLEKELEEQQRLVTL